MRMASILLIGSVLFGCGSSTVTPPDGSVTTETGTDAGAADGATDVPKDGDAGCDLGPTPGGTVAPFTASAFIVVKDDAGVTVPTPTGGDPKGDFRVAKVTVYLAPAAEASIDVSKSSSEGVGWFSFGDAEFRSSTDTKITLETTIVGTVKRGVVTRGKGTYVLEGSKVKLTPICGESTADSPQRELGWTRVDADHALVFLPPATTGPGAGMTLATILDLERIK